MLIDICAMKLCLKVKVSWKNQLGVTFNLTYKYYFTLHLEQQNESNSIFNIKLLNSYTGIYSLNINIPTSQSYISLSRNVHMSTWGFSPQHVNTRDFRPRT